MTKGTDCSKIKTGLCLVHIQATKQLCLCIQSLGIRKNFHGTGEGTTICRMHFQESNHTKSHQETEGVRDQASRREDTGEFLFTQKAKTKEFQNIFIKSGPIKEEVNSGQIDSEKWTQLNRQTEHTGNIDNDWSDLWRTGGSMKTTNYLRTQNTIQNPVS